MTNNIFSDVLLTFGQLHELSPPNISCSIRRQVKSSTVVRQIAYAPNTRRCRRRRGRPRVTAGRWFPSLRVQRTATWSSGRRRRCTARRWPPWAESAGWNNRRRPAGYADPPSRKDMLATKRTQGFFTFPVKPQTPLLRIVADLLYKESHKYIN